LDWGGRAGAIWDVGNMEPCCGDPCNPTDGLKCLACWYCCGPCSASKLYAHSLGQECALVNHVFPMVCLGFCATVALRHNIRVKHGKGPKPGDTSGLIGDLVMMYLCGPCAMCQILRAVDNDSWDWIKHLESKGIKTMEEPFIFLKDSGSGEHQSMV